MSNTENLVSLRTIARAVNPRGFTGSQGFTGSSGAYAALGYTGSQGFTGSQGVPGPQGEHGFTGSRGTPGGTGEQGERGYTGSIGYAGSQGVQGEIGYTGSSGAYAAVGFTGSQGLIGFTGSSAGGGTSVTVSTTPPQSPEPQDGDLWWNSEEGQLKVYYDDGNSSQWVDAVSTQKGYAGSRGTRGYTGSIGFAGSQGVGFTGSQGAGFTGSQGATGFIGSQGATGFTGSIGITGSIGFTGSQGATGFVGSRGDTGVPGALGYTGSIGYTGSGLTPYQYVSGATTLVPFGRYAVDTTLNAFSISLPASPASGTWIIVTDGGGWGVNNLTVLRNGSSIEGIADDLIINVPNITVEFVFTNNTWQVVATLGATGPSGDLGFTGSRGFTGSQGPAGAFSAVGFTGSAGGLGFTGSAGFTGSQGPAGAFSAIGFTGSQGPIGFTGSQGAVGFTGSQGVIGFSGSLGFTGSQGAGFTGSQGTTGFTGSAGTITSILGTTNRITTSGTSVVTLDAPQDLHTSANFRVNSLGIGTAASGTTGEIRATNEITAYYSDERLKTFTGKITDALDKITALNGYYFFENDVAKQLGYANDARQVGVSAQEVQKVIPEIVVSAPIDDAYLTVKYEKIIPVLIEAIKELNDKVCELTKNISKE